jgi:hypothetical protein
MLTLCLYMLFSTIIPILPSKAEYFVVRFNPSTASQPHATLTFPEYESTILFEVKPFTYFHSLDSRVLKDR